MNGSIQVKKGYLYAVINYKDEAGKTKYKWIATGLKERGNRKAAKEILEKSMLDFEERQKNKQAKIERRSKPKEVDKTDATMLFSDYCAKYVESKKAHCRRKFTPNTAVTTYGNSKHFSISVNYGL